MVLLIYGGLTSLCDGYSLTGAEFIASDLGLKPEETTAEQLGTARKVTITKDSTTIIATATSKDEIPATIAQINKNL